MDNAIIQIAIDGPAGSGKSTVAKKTAERLGILYLDTGAMYRAIALYASRNSVRGDDNKALDALFDSFNLEFNASRLLLNGSDITEEIRTKEIDYKVSEFAVNPFVRKKLVALQQKIGEKQSIIMEGRDICSVVLKNAPYKFYFDAPCSVRAKRRYLQNLEKGIPADYDAIYEDILRRDKIDSSREADPLAVAADAEVIDTEKYTIDEMVELIVSRVKSNSNAI